ncbi:MAG: S8 family peptidase [bacterium]
MREENLALSIHNPIPAIIPPAFPVLLFMAFLAVLLSAGQGRAAVVYPLGIRILQPRYVVNTVRPVSAPQEILLKFKPGVMNNQILAVYTRYQIREVSFSPYSGIRRCFLPAQVPVAQIITLLRAEPAVLYVEPNWFGYAHFIPNDPFFIYQWHLPMMNATAAWDISIGSGVVVAVLDTGVAYENFDVYGQAPDLAGTSFVAGYDFVNNDPNPDDDEGHGTHITGTIAQTTGNGVGCAGAAFGVTIMPVKVMDSTGSGALTDIVDGIYYAANNGAKIINMSLGFGDNPTAALEDAVNYAYNNGCLLVCSAGNNGVNTPNYPASYPACISVSGVRFDLTLGSYSNYGVDIDLCAPGGDLNVDQNYDGAPDGILQQTHDGTNFKSFGYYMGRGTSWAAANVSSVAAMVLSASVGTMTPADVRSILETTARDLGTAGWDEYYGWGMVNAYAAVSAAVSSAATAQVLGYRVPFVPSTVPAAVTQSLAVTPWWGLAGLGGLGGLGVLSGLAGSLTSSQWLLQAQTGWPKAISQQGVLSGIPYPIPSLIGQTEGSPSAATAQIMGLADWLLPLTLLGQGSVNSLVGSYTMGGSGLFTLNSTTGQLMNSISSQPAIFRQQSSSSANWPLGTQQSIQGIQGGIQGIQSIQGIFPSLAWQPGSLISQNLQPLDTQLLTFQLLNSQSFNAGFWPIVPSQSILQDLWLFPQRILW